MPPTSPISRQRSAAADPERARVLAAARAMLAEERAPSVTLDTVAARAGVARAQMQKQFGSLPGVLEALWDQLASDGCLAELPRAFALDDPTAVLAELIAIHARFWDAERRVVRRLRAFAALDLELERALRAREQDRRAGLRRFAARVLANGTRSKPAIEELVGMLALATAFETFDAMAGPDRSIAECISEVQTFGRAALERAAR